MSKTIPAGEIPDRLRRTRKTRAAREGMSLSEFVQRELARAVERPSMREWLERTRNIKPLLTERTSAQSVRELRDGK